MSLHTLRHVLRLTSIVQTVKKCAAEAGDRGKRGKRQQRARKCPCRWHAQKMSQQRRTRRRQRLSPYAVTHAGIQSDIRFRLENRTHMPPRWRPLRLNRSPTVQMPMSASFPCCQVRSSPLRFHAGLPSPAAATHAIARGVIIFCRYRHTPAYAHAVPARRQHAIKRYARLLICALRGRRSRRGGDARRRSAPVSPSAYRYVRHAQRLRCAAAKILRGEANRLPTICP